MALVALMALTMTSCSSGQSPTCDGVDAVRSAVEDVRNVNLSENGMAALTAGLGQVLVELDQLRATAATSLQPQVDALKTSVTQLTSSAEAAKANPTAASLEAVGTAIGGVRDMARSLADTVASTC